MIKKLFRKLFPKTRWYIWHFDSQNPENGYAIFGPFDKKELVERMNDAFADALASYGELEEFQMTDQEAEQYYINTREFWLKQAAKLTDD